MKITTFGGGTGSFHLLVALKRINNLVINAIVSVSDNGGSTGILRTLYGILPPGDIRNCLVALSNDTEIWTKLFNYRFDDKLNKHSLGNLILTALTNLTGSEEEAINKAYEILGIEKHKVIPVTFDKIQLKAILADGSEILGESEIRLRNNSTRIKRIQLVSESPIFPNPDALNSIMTSDFIVISPGSLYSSIMSTLELDGIVAALNKTKAKKIFVINIMTEPGETDDFKVSDFVSVLEEKVHLDYIIVNSKKPAKNIIDIYAKQNKRVVNNDLFNDERVILADLLNERNILRHDPIKLSRILEYIFINEQLK